MPAQLVHSSGFTSRQWRRLAEALTARGHRVIAPALLGYGETKWPEGEPFAFAQDVAHLAAQLDDGPAHVVGHSYGGFLALHLALAHPTLVRSLAVYEPVAFGVLDQPEERALLEDVRDVSAPTGPAALERWLERFVDWWNGPGAWQALAPQTADAFRAVGWKLSQEVASLALDETRCAGFAKIAAPTLVLGGERTQPAERRVVEKLAACLPHGRLVLFPELGHMGPIVAAPQVNAPILEHIAQHDA